MRHICEVLGFNKSTFYYQPRIDPSEEVLRSEGQRLAAAYPTDRYRRPTKVLVETEGHTVGYKRVSRLMKEENLSVSVKRVCQTTRSIEGPQPWRNHLKTLEICRCDQVWVGDITDVRLKHRFIYVALLMDVFTRMIRAWNLSQHLTQSLTLQPLEQTLDDRVPEIHHSDQGVQSLSSAYLSRLKAHGIEISVARRGCPWENGDAEIRTLKLIRTSMNRERIGHFITQVSHQKRPHSALAYLTPIEFQRQNLS